MKTFAQFICEKSIYDVSKPYDSLENPNQIQILYSKLENYLKLIWQKLGMGRFRVLVQASKYDVC
jgi:hypothetical protein